MDPEGKSSGCPGARMARFERREGDAADRAGTRPSELRQWPIQLHLVSPAAPYYEGADVLLAADCTAFALGEFHRDHLAGRSLAIACPKLDEGREVYVGKIAALIDEAKIHSLTVLVMQVPCCMGLLELAKAAAEKAERDVPIRLVVAGLQGEIIADRSA